ncbi:MAG: hypothetical protein ISR57_02980 [Bacteroidales bacterium]|nr:hypothetical protein [Bacteroidota bacterium]MBL6949586.1 hypothetical protein [Bacteroidales bacterium]
MIFATVVLFSTTGVTIYHHICGCSTPVIQTAHVSDEINSCCHVPETTVCCEEGDHAICNTEDSHNCTNEVTYLKVPIISTMPVQEIAVGAISFEIPDYRMPDAGLIEESLCDKSLIHSYVVPLRAGGPLFIFLHQIKIPYPEDHC